MTTQPVFLLARLDEDEAAAKAVRVGRWNSRVALLELDLYGLVSRQHPERVLADVEAKRRIVESLDAGGNWRDYDGNAWFVLCCLALPYADHPDYRAEWKP